MMVEESYVKHAVTKRLSNEWWTGDVFMMGAGAGWSFALYFTNITDWVYKHDSSVCTTSWVHYKSIEHISWHAMKPHEWPRCLKSRYGGGGNPLYYISLCFKDVKALNITWLTGQIWPMGSQFRTLDLMILDPRCYMLCLLKYSTFL